MEFMWNTLKDYFGDGFIPGSSPFSFNIHLCDLQPPTTRNANGDDGIELPEDAMSLFTTMGGICAPACSCASVIDLKDHLESFIREAPQEHVQDYTFHTGKNDNSLHELCIFSLRDSLQWWSIWQGHGFLEHRWKILYLGMAGLIDDIAIPPEHIRNGRFRFLGHSLEEILEGLSTEGVPPDEVKFLEMCLWRESIVQYVEKVDPFLWNQLVNKLSLMMQWRVLTANTHSGALLHMAAKGFRSPGRGDLAMEMASTCQLTGMDMAKEATGVLRGEKTETVVGDREQRKRELRWIHIRVLDFFNSLENAFPLRRYASSGYLFPLLMDRYWERVKNVRFPILPEMERIVESFTVPQIVEA